MAARGSVLWLVCMPLWLIISRKTPISHWMAPRWPGIFFKRTTSSSTEVVGLHTRLMLLLCNPGPQVGVRLSG